MIGTLQGRKEAGWTSRISDLLSSNTEQMEPLEHLAGAADHSVEVELSAGRLGFRNAAGDSWRPVAVLLRWTLVEIVALEALEIHWVVRQGFGKSQAPV